MSVPLYYLHFLTELKYCTNIESARKKNVEVVSKPQIRFKGKTQSDRESAATVGYVSIYRRSATQPLGLRWGFKPLLTYLQRKIEMGRVDFEYPWC